MLHKYLALIVFVGKKNSWMFLAPKPAAQQPADLSTKGITCLPLKSVPPPSQKQLGSFELWRPRPYATKYFGIWNSNGRGEPHTHTHTNTLLATIPSARVPPEAANRQLNVAHPSRLVNAWHQRTKPPDPPFLVFSSCSLISCDLPNYCN